jgi:hypothetical protein
VLDDRAVSAINEQAATCLFQLESVRFNHEMWTSIPEQCPSTLQRLEFAAVNVDLDEIWPSKRRTSAVQRCRITCIALSNCHPRDVYPALKLWVAGNILGDASRAFLIGLKCHYAGVGISSEK